MCRFVRVLDDCRDDDDEGRRWIVHARNRHARPSMREGISACDAAAAACLFVLQTEKRCLQLYKHLGPRHDITQLLIAWRNRASPSIDHVPLHFGGDFRNNLRLRSSMIISRAEVAAGSRMRKRKESAFYFSVY